MSKMYGKPVRIDEELDKMLREMAKKNKISIKDASRQLARINNAKIRGKRIMITDEIQF